MQKSLVGICSFLPNMRVPLQAHISLMAVGSFVVVDCAFCTCAGWCKKNLQKLLAAMKANILDDKKELSYTHGERTLDWEKVAFPPFSPEECKQKWKEVIQKVGQILTLT